MTAVNVPLSQWLKLHPQLKVLRLDCDGCGLEMRATQPFVEDEWAGVVAPPCKCGRNRHTCMSVVQMPDARSEERATSRSAATAMLAWLEEGK